MEIQQLPLGDYQTNCYILRQPGSSRCLVMDPGYDCPSLTQALKGLTVEAVLLTHGHFDHVGGVSRLAMDFDCPVYMGRQEVGLPPMMSAGPIPYTHLLSDGQQLNLAGICLRVLETPGHSPGSVCYLGEGALFSGDTLFAGSCGRTDFPGSDQAAMWASLGRLAQLPGDLALWPGHGEGSTLALEKQYNPYLRGSS